MSEDSLGEASMGDGVLVRLDVEHGSSGTKDALLLKVFPDWAPKGAERFLALVKAGFYDGSCFFRVIKNFVAQAGLPADPALSKNWPAIDDDEKMNAKNSPGFVSFASTSLSNSRSFQFFVNLNSNSFLDSQGFTPFAKVIAGIETLKRLKVTGEGAPNGPGPNQGKIAKFGSEFLQKEFPELSCITTARVVMDDDPLNRPLEPLEPVVADVFQKDKGNPFIGSPSLIVFLIVVFAIVFGGCRYRANKLSTRDLEA